MGHFIIQPSLDLLYYEVFHPCLGFFLFWDGGSSWEQEPSVDGITADDVMQAYWPSNGTISGTISVDSPAPISPSSYTPLACRQQPTPCMHATWNSLPLSRASFPGAARIRATTSSTVSHLLCAWNAIPSKHKKDGRWTAQWRIKMRSCLGRRWWQL